MKNTGKLWERMRACKRQLSKWAQLELVHPEEIMAEKCSSQHSLFFRVGWTIKWDTPPPSWQQSLGNGRDNTPDNGCVFLPFRLLRSSL